MFESKRKESSSSRWKRWKGKVIKQKKGGNNANFKEDKRKHGRQANNKSKNMNCFNCWKPDHFTRDWTKLKVLYDQTCYSNAYVCSCLMLAKIVPYWIVD